MVLKESGAAALRTVASITHRLQGVDLLTS
jgi:hypothetical protein